MPPRAGAMAHLRALAPAGLGGPAGVSRPWSGLEYILERFDDLLGSGAPGVRSGIDFFQRVDDVFTVQGDVGLGEGCAVACVEGGVPLFVLVAEAYDDQIRLLDHGAGADGVDLGRLVVTPEAIFRLAQVVAGGVRGSVVGDRGGKYDIQARGLGTALDFFAPIGVDLAG